MQYSKTLYATPFGRIESFCFISHFLKNTPVSKLPFTVESQNFQRNVLPLD